MKTISHYKDSGLLKFINIFSEYLVLLAAYYVSGFCRVYVPVSIAREFYWEMIVHYTGVALVSGIVVIFIYMICGDYSTVHIRNSRIEFLWICLIQSMSALLMSGLLFLINGWQFSRFWLIMYAIFGIVFMYVKRLLFQRIAVRVFGKYLDAYSVLLIGSGHYARRFYNVIKGMGESHYVLAGYLAAEENDKMTGYLGTRDELQKVLTGAVATQVVIAEDDLSSYELKEILSICSVYGIPAYMIPSFGDYLANTFRWNKIDQFLQTFGEEFKLFPVSAMNKSDILGVNIAVTNMEKTIKDITEHLDEWRGNYICVSNVHTTVMAHDSKEYQKVQNGAVMALPDGSPLSSYSRSNGDRDAERVTGPDLMKQMLIRSGENGGWRHFFYGSTQETLDKLAKILPEKYPDAQIAGMISPPFRELTPEEDNEYINMINEAKPDFLWVGLGAPKQEVWMAAHKDRVNCVMIGVGAAFDYEAGNIKRAPKWMQRLSLEWLYRLMQDPKRLFRRYVVTNMKYLWLTRR